MKMGWRVRNLGEILQKTETINPTKNPDEEFVYIDVSSVNNKTFLIEETTLLKGREAPSRARKLVKTNDVIFAIVRPTLRRISIITEEYNNQVCSTGYFVLRAKEGIDFAYIFYYLLTETFNNKMHDLQRGTSYPAVTDSDIREQLIVYPESLLEQQRIVALLDKAFATIAKAKDNAEMNLKNARKLFESYMQSVFTNPGENWNINILDQVCIVERGSSPRPIKNYLTNDIDGVNWIKIGDTKEVDKYIYSTKEKITIEGSKKSRFVKQGDLILSNSMSFGKPYIMKTTGYIHDGWFVLRPKSFLDTEYFYYLLVSPFMREQFDSLASGAIVLNISGDLVKKVNVPYPNLQEQLKIVAKLNLFSAEIKKLETNYKKKLTNLEELKKSILQKAFNGELTGV